MLKTIIIDDEAKCIEVLQLMLKKKFGGEVEIAATGTSAMEGISLIEEHQPDLVFLDIEMPGMNGLQMLQTLKNTEFQVIFTTAHQHYAIQAIKLNALDYLTKPIDLDELAVAIHKCLNKTRSQDNQSINDFLEQLKQRNGKKIAIPKGTTTQFVAVNDIVRVESQSNYSTIYFVNQPKQVVAKTLKELEEQLAPHNFVRVHHSHLVNLDHVIGFKNEDSGYLIVYGNEIVEISRRKKQEVMQRIHAL